MTLYPSLCEGIFWLKTSQPGPNMINYLESALTSSDLLDITLNGCLGFQLSISFNNGK